MGHQVKITDFAINKTATAKGVGIFAREHELYTGNTDYGDPEYNENYGGEVDGEDLCVDCIDEAESDAGYYSGIYEDDDE